MGLSILKCKKYKIIYIGVDPMSGLHRYQIIRNYEKSYKSKLLSLQYRSSYANKKQKNKTHNTMSFKNYKKIIKAIALCFITKTIFLIENKL